jgi:hypothetical protein
MTENDINSQAWRDAVSARKDCLSLEVLQHLADGSSDAEASQHMAGCPHCQAQLAMLKSFESSLPSENEGSAVAWIAAQLERNQTCASSADAEVWKPHWRNVLRVPYLAGAAALALVVGLGISFYISGREHHSFPGNFQGTDTVRSGSVRLTVPSGDLDLAPDDFRWEAYPGAKNYLVEVLEVDGTVLWSRQSPQDFLAASPELKRKMLPGKTLLWKVTAIDGSGRAIATSSQERFQVKIAEP